MAEPRPLLKSDHAVRGRGRWRFPHALYRRHRRHRGGPSCRSF